MCMITYYNGIGEIGIAEGDHLYSNSIVHKNSSNHGNKGVPTLQIVNFSNKLMMVFFVPSSLEDAPFPFISVPGCLHIKIQSYLPYIQSGVIPN